MYICIYTFNVFLVYLGICLSSYLSMYLSSYLSFLFCSDAAQRFRLMSVYAKNTIAFGESTITVAERQ